MKKDKKQKGKYFKVPKNFFKKMKFKIEIDPKYLYFECPFCREIRKVQAKILSSTLTSKK